MRVYLYKIVLPVHKGLHCNKHHRKDLYWKHQLHWFAIIPLNLHLQLKLRTRQKHMNLKQVIHHHHNRVWKVFFIIRIIHNNISAPFIYKHTGYSFFAPANRIGYFLFFHLYKIKMLIFLAVGQHVGVQH